MNAAFRGEEHPASWDWLAETLRLDLVLAQEAIKPDHLAGHGALIGAAGSSYGWGIWIGTLNDSVGVEPMQQLPIGEYTAPPALANSHPGSCAVATVTSPDGERVVAVSRDGLMDGCSSGS